VQSLSGCRRAREKAQVQLGTLDMKMADFEQAQADRIYAAMQLLFVPQVAARIEDAAALQADVLKMYAALIPLSRLCPSLLELRNAHVSLEIIFAHVGRATSAFQFFAGMRKQMTDIHRLVFEVREELFKIEYPFDHAKGATNIGRYCVPEMPLSDDLQALHDASDSMLDSLAPIFGRVVARLASTAERVETILGLAQLEPRKVEEELVEA
jgi:hypothetical protein